MSKGTLMSFPLVGNLSAGNRKDCGQAAMTASAKNVALLIAA